MPKVMMISGVKTLGSGDVAARVPVAGAYRPPIGRLVGQTNLGSTPGLSAREVRRGLMAPLLRGAGVGAMRQIPSYTRPEYIPGAMRLPQLAYPGAALGAPRIPGRAYTRPEYIPGAVRLPQLSYPGAALGYIPGQAQLPQLRGGLGDVDFCTDPGWVFANNLMAAAGAAMSSAAGTGEDRDDGWAAAGGTTTGAASAWRTTCTQVAQQRAQAAAAQGDPTEMDALRRQLEIERLRREAEGQAYTRYATYQQQSGAGSTGTGQVPQWVWYAGAAAVGVGVLAFMMKGGRRRR